MGESERSQWDAVVVGAGFGGLGAALGLARRGARVLVCEALRYPGGCASTFTRGGYHYESGATLFSGLAPGDVFPRVLAEHGLEVPVDWPDPVIELRAGGAPLPVPRDRAAFVDQLCSLPGAPVQGLRSFFRVQARVADALWPLFTDPARLPPLAGRSLAWHLGRAGGYGRILPLLGRPVLDLAESHGVADFAPLRLWLDAVCQITVQCPASEAEAPLALSALDYTFRGTGHVRGGVGVLAEALVEAIRRAGGTVSMADSVYGLERLDDGWLVRSRRGVHRTACVVANTLPQNLRGLTDTQVGDRPALDRLATDVAGGWGAAMLYLVLDGEGLAPGPHHLQLVGDTNRPFHSGHHVFVSVGDDSRSRDGRRTATVSTHVPMDALRGCGDDARGAFVADIQAEMRRTLAARAPEVAARVVTEMTASPRTFKRFTGRSEGLVGGIPRRAGLHNYQGIRPRAVDRGLYLVGDSVFPGQSTLATFLGGDRTAATIAGTDAPRQQHLETA